MGDPIRPSSKEFRAIYEQGFQVWSAIHLAAAGQTGLPSSYLDIHDAFLQHPSFPPDLRLKHVKHMRHTAVYATGCADWGSKQPDCEHALPRFQQLDQIPVALKRPIKLSTSLTTEPAIRWASWFTRGDQNCLAILILAWSYILSARWAEIMPEGTSLVYTSSMADTHNPHTRTTRLPSHLELEVDIGYAGPDETRWWAAVLAPDQGWQATLLLGEGTFLAPWSIRLQPTSRFLLSTTSAFQSHPAVAPSYLEALHFLDNFCLHRNAVDQSQAALAAVLLFPSMGPGKGLQLPALENPTESFSSTSHTPLTPLQRGLDKNSGSRYSWTSNIDHLDRLITLSCRSRGIRPMMLSGFYNSGTECNAVTPWIRGSLAAIDAVARRDPLAAGRMLMDRQPKVAALWLGATVLGLQQRLLRDVGFGDIPIDLPSAAWSGTIQSFIQEPVSDPLAADVHVSRADQCRLLFLSRSGSHDRVPVCQWKPFGQTRLEHTDLQVRAHAECTPHGLQYQGFKWDCIQGNSRYQPSSGDDPAPPPAPRTLRPCSIPVDYGGLDAEKDFMSENATRSIFGWLRIDGYAPGERHIWEHEWLKTDTDDDDDDEEEEEQSESKSGKTRKESSNVEVWLSQVSQMSNEESFSSSC